MADAEKKGWMGGSVKFGVSDELSSDEQERGPLLPLRLLVVADLVPRAPYNAGASAPEGAIRVDPQRFDDLFGKLRPRIAIEIPSVLADGKNVRVDLAPTSMKSFRPDGLCAEVPLLRALLDGRLVLERLRDGNLSPEQAQVELDRLWSGSRFVREIFGLLPLKAAAAPAPAPAAAPEPATSASIDSILDMVDVGGSTASAPAAYEPPAPAPQASAVMPSKFSEIISSVVAAARPGSGQAVRPTEAVNRIEKAIGAQIGAILQHPEVRRVEEAWRGLRFLAERTKNHGSIKIDLMCARSDDAAEALVRGIKEGAGVEPPVTCALVDLAIDNTPLGLARLETLAAAGEFYNVPVIMNGSAKLLGLDDLANVERLDNKGNLFSAPQQAPWRSTAAKPELRWAAIAMNAVLSRAPYDKSTSRMREAAIKELPADEGAYVWMAPGYALASLVIGSFRDTGWPHRIIGARNGGLVENLPVHQLAGGTEEEHEGMAIPTEAFISTDSQRELARSGVLALASAPNSDAAVVLNAPTAYVPPPKKTYDSATTEPEVRYERVSLVDQLFVARLVQFLRALCSKLPSSSDPKEVQPVVEGALGELFAGSGSGAPETKIKASASPEGTVVSLELHPRRFLGVQIEEISLEMPLG